MKNKINTDYSKRFIGVKLFREDFENILSLAEKTLQQVEIHDSTNMYENLDEVITHKGQNPKEISITGRNRDFSLEYFSFDVKNDYVSIYSRGSEKMYSFGLEIAELIKNKEDKYYTTLKPHNLLYITFLASTSLILFIDKETKTLSQPWLLWFVGVLGLLTLFSYFYKYLWVGLTLVKRHEYGFWNRNKDKIILALFGIIAGSIITLLIQLISSK
ncbi:hypothetical protein [Flavobacterium yafengii]|uniref:Uncharacterized protein n=1 Tax=Flavobacterium yafengii TaxID=3041253 RepID=A0AAW6TS28_9FLAO|nr:hypothetical protein [Flavobacterium yafengii]MDI5950438.1 hypothetical protein [Flavobacterium yafengii]